MNRKMTLCAQLVFEDELTVQEIAEELNISARTIYNWKKKDEFKTHIIQLERDYLKGLSGKAIRTMEDLLDARSEMVRYNAASDILDRTGHKPIEKSEIEHTGHIQFVDDINDPAD